MKLPIYFDYAATTPLDPRVLEKMLPYLDSQHYFGNPHSTHTYGRVAMHAVNQAREQVASLINADPAGIIWTSGATEAINLALKGIEQSYQKQGKHIVTCKTEHSAVLDTCNYLASQGYAITYLSPQSDGSLTLQDIQSALRADTILVSLMHVNNETGIIHDIQAISELLHQQQILFHVDAAQSIGKVPIDLHKTSVDLMSLSAHKVYGPKGIGALYIKPSAKLALKPLLHGGGQEQGLRSGTLPTHQIVGMGAAYALAQTEMLNESELLRGLRDKFWGGLQTLTEVYLNGNLNRQVPGILNIAFAGIAANELLPALRELAITTSSACHANSREPSRVLKAMGLSNALALSSLRFSWGRFTTNVEIEYAVNSIKKIINFLRNR